MTRQIIPPLVTPLQPDETIDESSVQKLTAYVLERGATGVFVLGTSGEGALLPLAQRRVLVNAIAAATDASVPFYVGASEPSVTRTLETIAGLEHEAIDAFVVTLPFYGALSEPAAQIRYFEALADAAARPILLYNIPEMVHSSLSLEAVTVLAKHPRIVGIKDSSGDIIGFQDFLSLRQDGAFAVYQGAERAAGLALLAGADGVVSGLGNIAPGYLAQMAAAAEARDLSRVLQLQGRLNDLWRLHQAGYWLSCLKYAAHLLDLCSPTVCAPHEPLGAQATRQILERLRAHQLEVNTPEQTPPRPHAY